MYKYILFFIILALTTLSCENKAKYSFPDAALDEKLETLKGKTTNIDNILKNHRGENVIIKVWASWCSDCIKSLPKVAQFQEENPEVTFILLSVDEENNKWQNGVKRYMDRFEIEGEQYHFPNGWDNSGDNAFIKYIGLDWIPRYILVGKDGRIKVHYAKSIEDKNISENL